MVEIISDKVLLIIVYCETPFVLIFKRLLAAWINSKNTHFRYFWRGFQPLEKPFENCFCCVYMSGCLCSFPSVVYTFCFLCLSVVYELKSRNWVEGDGWHFAGTGSISSLLSDPRKYQWFSLLSTPQQWMNRQKKVKGTLKTLSQMQMCGLPWHPKYLFGKLAAKVKSQVS